MGWDLGGEDFLELVGGPNHPRSTWNDAPTWNNEPNETSMSPRSPNRGHLCTRAFVCHSIMRPSVKPCKAISSLGRAKAPDLGDEGRFQTSGSPLLLTLPVHKCDGPANGSCGTDGRCSSRGGNPKDITCFQPSRLSRAVFCCRLLTSNDSLLVCFPCSHSRGDWGKFSDAGHAVPLAID